MLNQYSGNDVASGRNLVEQQQQHRRRTGHDIIYPIALIQYHPVFINSLTIHQTRRIGMIVNRTWVRVWNKPPQLQLLLSVSESVDSCSFSSSISPRRFFNSSKYQLAKVAFSSTMFFDLSKYDILVVKFAPDPIVP